MMLRDDVLIENIKYGCIIMQNNGAMKIVNFTHAQMAKTSCSFCCLGTRLMVALPEHSFNIICCCVHVTSIYILLQYMSHACVVEDS